MVAGVNWVSEGVFCAELWILKLLVTLHMDFCRTAPPKPLFSHLIVGVNSRDPRIFRLTPSPLLRPLRCILGPQVAKTCFPCKSTSPTFTFLKVADRLKPCLFWCERPNPRFRSRQPTLQDHQTDQFAFELRHQTPTLATILPPVIAFARIFESLPFLVDSTQRWIRG